MNIHLRKFSYLIFQNNIIMEINLLVVYAVSASLSKCWYNDTERAVMILNAPSNNESI